LTSDREYSIFLSKVPEEFRKRRFECGDPLDTMTLVVRYGKYCPPNIVLRNSEGAK
jgi:hypothetical protein